MQTCCQMHTILDYTTDEKIWKTLQSQWAMCKCTNTIGPGTKILPHMLNEWQLHPVKLKCKLEYKSHYMYQVIWKGTVTEAITWLKQHNPHYADIIPNDDWYSSITNSELATLVHEDEVHQERSQSTLVNINTQTHDPDLDDEEQIHEEQSTDDILNVKGNKAVVIEINTNGDEETDNELREEQAALDHKQELTADALPSVVQIENLKDQVYQCAPGKYNIPKYILLDEDLEVLAFPDFFPYGEGGYYSEQSTKLPIQKYFQQHLLNVAFTLLKIQNAAFVHNTVLISNKYKVILT